MPIVIANPGRSGIRIPNPIKSMKIVRKIITRDVLFLFAIHGFFVVAKIENKLDFIRQHATSCFRSKLLGNGRRWHEKFREHRCMIGLTSPDLIWKRKPVLDSSTYPMVVR